MLAARAWRLPARMWSAVSGSIRKRTFASLAAFQSTTPLTSAVASAHHDAHGHGHDAHGHARDAHGHAHDDHGHGHDDHGHGHGHHDPNKTSVDPPTDMGWTDIWYRAPYFPFNNNPEGAYEKTIPNNPYPGHSQPHEWSRPYPYPTAFHIPVPFGTGEEHVLDKDDPRWLDRYGRLPAGHQPKPQIVSTEPGWHFRQDQQLAHSTTYTPTSSDPYSSRVRYEHETFEWTISENWRGKFEPFPEIWWDDGRGRKEFLGDWDPYVTGTKAFFSFLAVFLGTMTPYFLAGYTLCIWMGPKQRYENSVPFRGLYLDYGGDPQFIDNMPASLPDGNCCYPG